MKIILASASPRRRELMKLITEDFQAVSTDADETLPANISSESAAEYLSGIKARSAWEENSDALIIGCDTMVICDSEILGKPKNKEECRRYMNMLSGRSHKVITGCTLMANQRSQSFSVCTEVFFRKLTEDEVESYISTDEPYDKAGGYGIQGKAALFTEKIIGDYFNVVGLPVSELNIQLNNFLKEINMKDHAFKPADILIPKKGTDLEKWAVVACDQYTSEPEYWQEVKNSVGDSVSSLSLILPEIYLEDNNVEDRISDINKSMDSYISQGVFEEYKDAMIYVERIQSNGILRQGIVGKIDLEKYDFSKGSASEVRATEATVVERIPPRIKVRRNAQLELPHIMILIDDPDNTVIEPMAKDSQLQEVYNIELMQGGGSVKGSLISDNGKNQVLKALDKLAEPELFNKKYSLENSPVLLFAMGDGNHSLATAKEFYEQLKKANPDVDMSEHPARYALAEIVNLHSPALQFEAIHRLVYDIDCDKLVSEMNKKLDLQPDGGDQTFCYVVNGQEKTVTIGNKTSNLTVGSLQNFLDCWIKENGGKIDYIHGAETVKSLANKHNGIAFILPDMDKSQLFPTVIKDGALPRKTFSMGHAADKRYYVECRKIVK